MVMMSNLSWGGGLTQPQPPFSHEACRALRGASSSCHVSFIGRAGVLNFLQPISQVCQVILKDPQLVLQKTMVLFEKGSFSFGKFSSDLRE